MEKLTTSYLILLMLTVAEYREKNGEVLTNLMIQALNHINYYIAENPEMALQIIKEIENIIGKKEAIKC